MPTDNQTKIGTAQPKILLVEDNLIAQKATSLLLNTLGCSVDVAPNGEKAIAMFQPGKYQLIFMDIGLPDVKGYQVAQHFRKIENNTPYYTPILALSAHAEHDEEEAKTKSGMEEILNKPLLFDQAKIILNKYIPSWNLPCGIKTI